MKLAIFLRVLDHNVRSIKLIEWIHAFTVHILICLKQCTVFLLYFRIQSILRYHGIKGNVATSREGTEIEDRFDTLVDANDQLLERIVSILSYTWKQAFNPNINTNV